MAIDAKLVTAEGRVDVGPVAPRYQALSLKRNFSWTLLGQLIFSACNWAMTIAVAKLGDPAMVGQYALGIAVTQPVFMLTGLHLRTVQITDVRGEYRLGHFVALRLVCILLSLLAILGLASWFGTSAALFWAVLFTGIGVGLDQISDLTYAVFTKRDRLDRMSLSLIIRGPLSLGLLAFGTYCMKSVVWGIAGSALASLVTLLIYDLPACNNLLRRPASDELTAEPHPVQTMRPLWEHPVLWQITRNALPLGLVLCLGSLNTHLPRYFIEKFIGEKSLGVFAAMALIVNAGRTAVLSLSFATTKRLADAYDSGNRRAFLRVLRKMSLVSAIVGILPVLVALVGGRALLTLVYRPEYASHVDLFVLVLMTGALWYQVICIGCGLTAARVNALQFWWTAASTLVLFLLCAWLIPAQGLRGAAIASLAAVILQVVSGVVLLLRLVRGRSASSSVGIRA